MQPVSRAAPTSARVNSVLGRENVTRSVSGGIFVCATEQVERAYWHYHVRAWYTVFSHKIFPGPLVGDYVECFSCRNTYDPRIVGSTHPALRVAETS